MCSSGSRFYFSLLVYSGEFYSPFPLPKKKKFLTNISHTTNMLRAFHEPHDTYTMLVSFYLAARLLMALSCLAAALLVPLVRGAMIGHIIHILIASAFWIASTSLHMPNRLIPIFIAIAIDLFGSMVHVAMFRYGRSHDSKTAQRFARLFEFYPAVNIEHKVERTGAFISLVLGYSVVALIFQNTSEFGLNAFLGKAVLGLVQSFVFNWLYFEVDGAGLKMHAIRRHPNSGMSFAACSDSVLVGFGLLTI